MATLITEWGKRDCLIDLFGDDAHERIKFGDSHDESFEYVASLSERKRWALFRRLAKENGWRRNNGLYDPGDAAIGNFQMSINRSVELPRPWFAIMGVDFLWYTRMPRSIKVVDCESQIEVYKQCQAPR